MGKPTAKISGKLRNTVRRACLAVLVSFLTWNYFINAMGMTWGHYFGVDFSLEPTAGSGLTMMAGIKTLDTSIIGAIVISGIVTAIHNRMRSRKVYTQTPSAPALRKNACSDSMPS